MKTRSVLFASILLIGSTALAATHYVDITSTNPVSPYTNWVTAANNIQDAIDVAVAGETVLVADGHYLLTSEIWVNKYITIQSVNGPSTTIVDGQGSVRCFNLGNFVSTLNGFTVTNGYMHSAGNGGGIYCAGTAPIVTNCVIIGNNAGAGDGTHGGLGGGIYRGRIWNCSILDNLAKHGGGMRESMAYNCSIAGNTARYYGGGIYGGAAFNCTISGNSASVGGGAIYTDTSNCIVWDNRASHNSPDIFGGNAAFTCSPDVEHGLNGNITNFPILVSASHVASDSPCRGAGSISYAFGTDIDGVPWQDPPSMGADEINGMVTGVLHCAIDCQGKVVAGSPLRIKGIIDGTPTMHDWSFGDGTYATNTIRTEHVWNTPGSYNVVLTAYNDDDPLGIATTQTIHVANPESTAVHVAKTGNDSNDGATWSTAKATIQAGVDAQAYAGGMVLVSNGVYLLESEITVANDIAIHGVGGPLNTIVDGQGKTRCFNLGTSVSALSGLTITNGYAVGLVSSGGGIFCIGCNSLITNCVVAGNRAGYEAGGIHSGTVSDCRILNNTAQTTLWGGGGMVWVVAHNCIVSGNTAREGGGIRHSIANNCLISSNSATYGGGVFGSESVINNCTIIGNTANYGGGVCNVGTFKNCIVYYNTATVSGDNWYDIGDSDYSYCCTTPHPGGTGNINGNPLFVDYAAGDYHLATNSPCINAGSNGDVKYATDLDGNPRIVDGTVDMGTYESGFEGCFITNIKPSVGGMSLEWTAFPMWEVTVMYSTNLVTMPFIDLSVPMPHPMNSYTDLVHGAESECFYRIEISP